MSLSPRSFFVFPTSGRWFEVDDPVRWCLANAGSEVLARARARLLFPEATDDPKRVIAVVLRRCGLALAQLLRPDYAVVRYWTEERRPDLRPWLKAHRLASADTEVTLVRVKSNTITVTRGDEYLYGTRLGGSFPLGEYKSRWERRGKWEMGGVAPVPVTYCWAGHPDSRIPWAVLDHLWRRDELRLCPNCDVPLILYRFDYVRCGLTSFVGVENRACPACRRQFEDRPDQWHCPAMKSLPPELRPSRWTGFGFIPDLDLRRQSLGRPREWGEPDRDG